MSKDSDDLAECEDDKFDLATQLRIANRDKRTAEKMGDERVRRDHHVAYWGVGLAIAAILAGLAFTVWAVGYFG